MMKTAMKKVAALMPLAFALVVLSGCNGPMAITGAGSVDGDALISVGKVIEGKAEVGITAVAFEGGEDQYTPAVGPYGTYLVPMPDDIKEDWQPFVGGALLLETDNASFLPKAFAGVIYKPQDALSPVYFAEKAWPSEDISNPGINDRSDDLYHWLGIRYRF